MRTKPHISYIEPSPQEIAQMAQKVGLKTYSPQLAKDLANVASGGRVCVPSEYRSKVEMQVKEQNPKSSYNSINTIVKKKMLYHQNVCDFLHTIDMSKAIGNTPLQKSMTTLKLLSQQSGGSGSEGGGNSLPIFSEDAKPEATAKKIEEQIEMTETLSEVEKEFVDEEGDLADTNSNPLAKLKVAEDMSEGKAKKIMLEVSRVLDSFKKLQVRKQTKLVADPEGDKQIDRPMKNLSELAMVGGQDWAMYKANKSYFMYQAVSGAMPVRERVTNVERKQAIFILVDGSGSMSGTRHYKATGVVMNRLKSALKGDSVVYISVFDTEMSKVEKAETPEEAKQLVKKFADGNFSGGGTDIAKAVKQAHTFIEKEMKDGKMLYKPEVVVLTDDDSSSKNITKHDVKGTTVHGFAIEDSNPALKTFAESTGGLYFQNF